MPSLILKFKVGHTTAIKFFYIPKPTVDITEYRLFSGQYLHCKEIVKAEKPENVPQGIIGSNLLSYIGVLAGQYHLSIRKIQSLLKEQLGTNQSGFNADTIASNDKASVKKGTTDSC